MTCLLGNIVDIHCHVGLLGDTWPQWGRLSPGFLEGSSYPFFLAYARIDSSHVTGQGFPYACLTTIQLAMPQTRSWPKRR